MIINFGRLKMVLTNKSKLPFPADSSPKSWDEALGKVSHYLARMVMREITPTDTNYYMGNNGFIFDTLLLKRCNANVELGDIGVCLYSGGNHGAIDGFYIVNKIGTETLNGVVLLKDGGSSANYSISKAHFIPLEVTPELVKRFEICTREVRKRLDDYDKRAIRSIFSKYPNLSELIEVFKPPRCKQCGKPIEGEVVYYKNESYCTSCYTRFFARCSRCNEVVRKDELFPTVRDGHICSKCNKREYITSYHHHYPLTKFYGNGETMPFMGIELEIDEGGKSNNTAKQIVNHMNTGDEVFMWCSSDSSLHDGLEMITQPATCEYHCSIKQKYQSLFVMLKKMGYLSHDTSTCGLHVHINRNFFGDNSNVQDKKIKNLLLITQKFWKEFVTFSRRNYRRLDHYSKKSPEDTNWYISQFNKSGNHSGHYFAINITNADTIEFRIFRGTLNINTFIATLQLVNAMVIAAKTKSPKEIEEMKFEDLCIERTCRKYWNIMRKRIDTEE